MDPNQMQQVHQAGALFAGMGAMVIFFAIIFLAVGGFMIFLFWRIFNKAGLPGPLALLLFLGPIGMFINACILAFAQWKVAPVAAAPAYYPPAYPPASTTQG